MSDGATYDYRFRVIDGPSCVEWFVWQGWEPSRGELSVRGTADTLAQALVSANRALLHMAQGVEEFHLRAGEQVS